MKLSRLPSSVLFVPWLIASLSLRLSDAYSDASASSSSAGLSQAPDAQLKASSPQVLDPAAAAITTADPPQDVISHVEDLAPPELTQSQPSLLQTSELGGAAATGTTSVGSAAGAAATTPSANSPPPLLRRGHLPRLKIRGVVIHPRLANLADRTVPAAVLLSLLFGVTRWGGELGLRWLLVALTPGLFHEAVSVASRDGGVATLFSNRWGWFAAYSLVTTLPLVVPTAAAVSATHLRYAGYALSLLCWVGWVLRLNSKSDAESSMESSGDKEASRFASAWGEISTYHMAAFVALVPIHSLLAVLRAGRMDWAMYACLLVICNDTFAYLVGHFVGRRPLLPVISPKKTLEGWAGGFLLTTLASPLLWKWLFQQSYTVHSLHIALFGSLVAPFGGYLASTAKRAFGKKDFGTLLGSHGGLLDRLDCQLITASYLYLFLAAIGEIKYS